MSRGVIYMCWGEQAMEQARLSMASLWERASLPVMVVGDESAAEACAQEPRVTVKVMDVDPFDRKRREGFRFLAGRIKPLLYRLSPFDESLYVDADTDFAASPDAGFDLLDRWDFIVAETETRTIENGIADAAELR